MKKIPTWQRQRAAILHDAFTDLARSMQYEGARLMDGLNSISLRLHGTQLDGGKHSLKAKLGTLTRLWYEWHSGGRKGPALLSDYSASDASHVMPDLLIQEVQRFRVTGLKGFGLMQRYRDFKNYTDIELAYESRPTYWIEPKGQWGEGRLELIELATKDETADNIVLSWRPKETSPAGKASTYAYRLTALLDDLRLSPAGRVVNTFTAPVGALGSGEDGGPGTRRFLVDFAGGDVGFYLGQSNLVELVSTASNAKIIRAFLTPNPKISGFRVTLDVSLAPGTTTDMRIQLRAAGRALTETWTYSWNDEQRDMR